MKTYPGIKLVLWIGALWLCCAIARCQVISIDCGSPTTDTAFLGGLAYTDASMGDPPLNSLRYGVRFSYRVPAPPGIYLVKLSFVEPNQTAAGRRLFTVTINGQTSDAIDLFKEVGLKKEHVIQTTAISYWGFVKIDFTGLMRSDFVVTNAVVTQIQLAKYPVDAFSIGWQRVAQSYECIRGIAFAGQHTLTVVSTLDGETVRVQPVQLTTTAAQTAPAGTCAGIRAARFNRADGTQTEPYILIPSTPGIEVLDLTNPLYWRAAPIP